MRIPGIVLIFKTVSSSAESRTLSNSTLIRGGPIELELTGAVSRAVMLKWDKMYLRRIKKADIKILLNERYVDDSNQMAMVPPP